MAYTSAPETQTYSSVRVPAAWDIDFRSNTGLTSISLRKDAGMINLIPRKYKGNSEEYIQAESRESIVADTVISGALAGSNVYTVRGMYVWEKLPGTLYYYVVVNNNTDTKVYSSTTGLSGSWASVNTLSNITTPVGFTEFIDGTNTKSLILVDGIEGYVYTTNAAGTKIVDVDFPSPHTPFPVFIDGYLFLAKTGTGDIYNSDLNNPAAWTAGSFISSELYPDDIQAIVKINNYLLAIGTQGCEYFYDAANVTASPLARYEGASLPFGCLIPSSIVVNKNTLVMLANNNDGEATLKIVEDFKFKDISPPWLISTLNDALQTSVSTNIHAFFIRQNGELLYVLKFPLSDAASFAYNFNSGYWVELTSGSTTSPYTGLVGISIAVTSFSTSNNLTTFVAGARNFIDGSGTPLTKRVFFGTMGPSYLSTSYFGLYGLDYYTGSSTIDRPVIYQEIRTPLLDFGTLNKKTISRFGVAATTVSFNQSPNTTNLTVYWSQYDTYSASLAPVPVNQGTLLIDSYINFPFITQLGQCRQMMFKVVFNLGGTSIRFKHLEIDINKGQQ